MGKTRKWLRILLIGKRTKEKEKEKGESTPSQLPTEMKSAPAPAPAPKEKRWSFRRPTATGKYCNSPVHVTTTPSEVQSKSQIDQKTATGKYCNSPVHVTTTPSEVQSKSQIDQKNQTVAVAVATVAAANAVVVAAQTAAAVVHLNSAVRTHTTSATEEAAAIKIQSIFRSYLAMKALRALKGLVKLQALVRGHLVRKQATATLRCIQALLSVQARARAQRIQMIEGTEAIPARSSFNRRSPQHSCYRPSQGINPTTEEYVKTMEVNLAESRDNSRGRKSYSIAHSERTDQRFSEYYGRIQTPHKADYQQNSPAPSALTDISPRTCSGHFEEFPFTTAQNSPQCLSAVSVCDATQVSYILSQQESAYSLSHEYPFFPNYMANTESSKAKARSQSAPKQRPDSYERQSSRRRPSVEGRNIPRSVKMQRSSSHIVSSAHGYQYPWYIKLDKSSMSLKDSECGSTSTVLSNTNYCRYLVPHEISGSKY